MRTQPTLPLLLFAGIFCLKPASDVKAIEPQVGGVDTHVDSTIDAEGRSVSRLNGEVLFATGSLTGEDGVGEIALFANTTRFYGSSLRLGSHHDSFDNDFSAPGFSLILAPEVPENGLFPVFRIFGAARSGHMERIGDTTQNGFITVIDGSNPALTPITDSRNIALELDYFSIGGEVSFTGQLNGFDVWAGPIVEHSDFDYSLREQVSGGGPFFSHNLDLDLSSTFFGPKFGIGKVQPYKDVIVYGSVWGAAGVNRTKMTVNQFGTALPAASASDTENEIAFRAGVNAGVGVPLGRALLNFNVFADLNSAAPNVDYPSRGGTAIQAASDMAYGVGAKVGVTIPLGGSDRLN
ncbi:hypothetical protein [Hoeflea poritis]|uniref:Porin n=1 Tax=Hoeflea poritis TaxID=2993659 RepID=A0ABT4VRR5_9HYPH|nr:hypothetical protein [Hoeflea poritis]MDA4847392.1 hypothetical protein [Hoeflea poritis]